MRIRNLIIILAVLGLSMASGAWAATVFEKANEGIMGLTQPVVLNNPQAVNLTFSAKGIVIANPTGFWVFVRIGGNDIPNSGNSSDLYAPPYTYISAPITGGTRFGLGLSAVAQGVTPSLATAPTVTFYEDPVSSQVANVQTPNTIAQAVSINNLVSNMQPGANNALVIPLAGQTLQVFRIQGELNLIGTPPASGGLFTFFFWDGAGGSQIRIIAHNQPGTTITDLNPPIDWTPFGNRGAVGQGLYINLMGGSGYQGYYDLSVMYSLAN